jgi:hypothetical protein
MTLSNNDLTSRFYNGGGSGQANNMEIETFSDGSAILWGYGWAVYGFRTPNGKVFKFTGWEGYSQSTTQQMGTFTGATITEIDARPESKADAINEVSVKA